MILFLFLPLESLLGPDHNLKSYSSILHFQTTMSHNFPIIRNPYYFFFSFSSVQGLTTQIGLLAYDILNSKTGCFTTLHLFYLGVTTKTRASFFGEWPILRAPASKPFRGHQGQVSIIDTHRSSTAGNGPQGPRSATRGGVGTAVPQTQRAISWRARIGNEPEASPVWLQALATSAA